MKNLLLALGMAMLACQALSELPGIRILGPRPGERRAGMVSFAFSDVHAHDVVTFLAWAAQPELEERKRLGVKVLLFLIVLTAMLYAVKRKIWSDVH